MTIEEQAAEKYPIYQIGTCNSDHTIIGKEVRDAYIAGAKEAIEKAYKWLDENAIGYEFTPLALELFKQEMEGME